MEDRPRIRRPLDNADVADWHEAVQAHYEKAWAPSAMVHCVLDENDIRAGMEGFTVLEIPPDSKRPVWTYATCGMSMPDDKELIELHLCSPKHHRGHAELLTAVAHYHRTGAHLGCWHTVNFGRPWLPGSLCDYGLLSLPYLDGSALEKGCIAGHAVSFLWLIPITRAEREYKLEQGIEALEQRFEQCSFNYADPARPSVV